MDKIANRQSLLHADMSSYTVVEEKSGGWSHASYWNVKESVILKTNIPNWEFLDIE